MEIIAISQLLPVLPKLRIKPFVTFLKKKIVHCFSELSPSQYALHAPQRMTKGINNQTFQKTSYGKSGGVLDTDRNCVGM